MTECISLQNFDYVAIFVYIAPMAVIGFAFGWFVKDSSSFFKGGNASELLGCVNWLIDDKNAAFITGITIPVDGGFLSRSGL